MLKSDILSSKEKVQPLIIMINAEPLTTGMKKKAFSWFSKDNCSNVTNSCLLLYKIILVDGG